MNLIGGFAKDVADKVTLSRWDHSLRRRETFSDATCLCSCLVTAFARAERSRTLPDLPEQGAFHPLSGQPTQTIGRAVFELFSKFITPGCSKCAIGGTDHVGIFFFLIF